MFSSCSSSFVYVESKTQANTIIFLRIFMIFFYFTNKIHSKRVICIIFFRNIGVKELTIFRIHYFFSFKSLPSINVCV